MAAKHMTVKERQEASFEKLKGDFGYKNKMASPKMKKVVINVGTGT
jgi:ribosomal protein L5